jgi:hypothetical protein
VRRESWWVVAASAVAAAGVGLTWESNPLGGERSGLSVLFGHHHAIVPALVLVGGLLVAPAAAASGRRGWAVAASVVGLAVAGWYGFAIVGDTVRAIGVDSAGNLIEPEAASRPGIGWYVTVVALLAAAETAWRRAPTGR